MFLGADDVLHQHKPVDESVRLQLKASVEMADKNLEKLFEYHAVPWRYLTHSTLLSFHRRCKDTIVLTVLQPHQVSIMSHTLAFMFLSFGISLTLYHS